MPAYADTSFLFSVYIRDVNTTAALAYLGRHPAPLPVTGLQHCELVNAIRLSVFRRNTPKALADAALKKVEQDFASGNLINIPLASADLFDEALHLSGTHTEILGVRTLDLLHIAAAIRTKATLLLTFDHRQFAGAKAVGLRAGP